MWHVVARTLPSLLLQHWLLRIEWHGYYIVGHQPLHLPTLLWVCVHVWCPTWSCHWNTTVLPVGTYAIWLLITRHFLKSVYSVFPWVTTPIFFLKCYHPQQSMRGEYNAFWGCIGFYLLPSRVFKRPNIWVHPDKAGSFWSSSWCYQSPLEFWSHPLGSTWSHLGWS